MSRNLAQHRLDRKLTNTLNGLSQNQSQGRTLQRQGSESIRVESIVGYIYLPVPASGVPAAYYYIDIESDNQDDIMVATLIRSMFIGYDDGTFENADLEDYGLPDRHWAVFLAYDNRTSPSEITVAEDPVSTIGDRAAGALDDYSIPYYKARIVVKNNYISGVSIGSEYDQYLLMYEIRAIIG